MILYQAKADFSSASRLGKFLVVEGCKKTSILEVTFNAQRNTVQALFLIFAVTDNILPLSWTNRVTARCEEIHSRGWWGRNWSRTQSYSRYPADHDALSHIPRSNTCLFLDIEINHFRTRLCVGTASHFSQSLHCQWSIIQDDAKVYRSAQDMHLCWIKQVIIIPWKAKNCLELHPQFGDARFWCAAPAGGFWTSRSCGCSWSGDGLTHIQLTFS